MVDAEQALRDTYVEWMVISKYYGLPVASEAPGHAGVAPWSWELMPASALSTASLQALQLPGMSVFGFAGPWSVEATDGACDEESISWRSPCRDAFFFFYHVHLSS